jgi:putative ABC transport system substrate-binding protein
VLGVAALFGFYYIQKSENALPLVAIANYGPHASLEAIITGLKEGLAEKGFVNKETVRYDVMDVGFQPALIAQMLTQLNRLKPAVMVTLTTPVAQLAKMSIHNTPLVYAAVMDPIEAGLLKERNRSEDGMTGVSDEQNLEAILTFAQQLLPDAKRVGLLYSTAEANDRSLLLGLQAAADKMEMEVVAIGIDEPRDIALRMPLFKDRVDFFYVGTSGPIQPSLPTIAAEADKMNIPIINSDDAAVKEGWVLASFGVNYEALGRKAGHLVSAILGGASVASLQPVYPFLEEHRAVIHQQRAFDLNLRIPDDATLIK